MARDWLNPKYQQDLVSVIIPCHNQERFLPACLASVANQDYQPLEIIIVDDGSSDGTREIMREFQRASRQGITVKCLFQENRGAQHARNRACSEAHGEFIQFLDGDDLLCRQKLTEQIVVFKTDSAVDVVYGDGQYLIDFGGPTRNGRIISIGHSTDIIESLLYGSWVPPFSYLSRRSAVQRCGPWDESIRVSQDFEYFLRMAIEESIFSYKPGISGQYRKHSFATISEQSISLRSRTRQRILAQAEHRLLMQNALTEKRILAIVENHRRIARQVYLADGNCFRSSLTEILKLCPHYLPTKRRARLITSLIGVRYYETLASILSHMIHKNKKDWF